jgi:hypothetical protein
MKRSGHHAIIIWLGAHFPRNSVHFINDVVPFLNPFRYHSNTRRTTTRSEAFVQRRDCDIAAEQEIRKNCLMYSYEDRRLTDLANEGVIRGKSATIGASRRKLTALVLRDPFNTVASRLKSGWHLGMKQGGDVLDLWLSYANEFIGATNHLDPKVTVNFNRWFSDQAYRVSLSTVFGLPFTDDGLNRVASNGNGSSWSWTEFDHRAQEMKVLDRWQEFAMDQRFRKLFSNRQDVRRLSETIFGNMNGTESLFTPRVRSPRFSVMLRQPARTSSLQRLGSVSAAAKRS